MMMNMQETMYKKIRNQEVRYQALLKAKDLTIEAQGKLVKAIQTRHKAIEKQLRGYSDGDLYAIHENPKQINAFNTLINYRDRALLEARKSEQAKINMLTGDENERNNTNRRSRVKNSANNVATEGATSLYHNDGNQTTIIINGGSTSGDTDPHEENES